jgi:hypothetical protein
MRSSAYNPPISTISTVRADALFASTLQSCDQPSAAQVQRAIGDAIRVFGVQGCAARVAQAYGDRPETAMLRMRWARAAVTRTEADGAFGAARREPARVPVCCAA